MNPSNFFAKIIVDRDEEFDPHDWLPPLDRKVARRDAVRLLGFSAAAALVGCATESSVNSSTSTGTTATTTTLAASSTSTTTGTNITLTATVSPTAVTGTVTFYNGSASLGSATLSSGTCTLATSFSSAGTETLTAVYAGNSSYATSTSNTVTISVTGSTVSCSESLEGEEGPYFVDDSATGYNRSNILTNIDGTSSQTGVALTLTLYVYDAKNSCAAMQNVQVDIWQCNASGIYSAESVESTSSDSWLRGYQLTDASGMVQFVTIIPGWYAGRTNHIHLRLRSTYDSTDNSGTNTMQFFFDQTLVDTLSTSVNPYSSEGTNPTTNATDRVYSTEEDGTTLMTLAGSTSAGYTATMKVYLPIES